jgi:hypothetical protein
VNQQPVKQRQVRLRWPHVVIIVILALGAILYLRHEQTPTSSAIQALNNNLYGAPTCSLWDRIWANNGCGF